MKAVLITLALAVSMIAGCKTATVNQPLAPGYSTQADQTIGRSLAAAHGYYVQIQTDVVAGKYKPSATEVTALNSFAISLNAADAAYLAYHNGTGTFQAAQTAANQVAAQQGALQASVGVK